MAVEQELPRHVWVPALAKRIIARHWTAGSCEKCQDGGCESLTWARNRLTAYRMTGNWPDRYGLETACLPADPPVNSVMASATMAREYSGMTTAARYVEFAAREARDVSPVYERLSLAVSRDDEVLARLDTLPPAKRQPNLLFGVVRLLGGPVEEPAAFHDYTVANWAAVEAQLRIRATQTNEAGRCAVLLPVLAALPQPLALLEVGASAGLCLYPDRYAYRYNGRAVGAGEPVLDCAATGIVPPAGVPEVVWRAGLDLNPLDVTDPADVAWLDALIWPEHTHRRARLRAAVAVAAAEPPLLVRGDLVDDLPALAARAPAGATLVVFHTSVLYQVPAPRRAAFAEVVRGLSGHWIANETPDVLPYDALPEPPDEALHNVLALDGTPLAWTGPHGQMITRFG